MAKTDQAKVKAKAKARTARDTSKPASPNGVVAAMLAATPQLATAHGIKAAWQGHVLTLAIDCGPQAVATSPMSGTGKSRSLASTHGWLNVARPDGSTVGVSLNVNDRQR